MDTELLDTDTAARRLGIRPATLRRWRTQGQGPPYLKIGALVYYEVDELRRWITAQRRRSTADAGQEQQR